MEGDWHSARGHGHADCAPVVLVCVLDHVIDGGVDHLHAPGAVHLHAAQVPGLNHLPPEVNILQKNLINKKN